MAKNKLKVKFTEGSLNQSDDTESCLEDTLETIKRTVSKDTDNPTMRKVVH